MTKFIAHRGIIIGQNISNLSSRSITLKYVFNLYFHLRDSYSSFRASSRRTQAALSLSSPLIEPMQCGDGSLSLSISDLNMADVSSMIDSII